MAKFSTQSNFLWTIIFYSHAYRSACKSGPGPWGISPEKGWVSRRGGAGNFQSYTKSNYWNLSGHFAAQWFSLFEYIFHKTSSWTLEVLHLFCFVCIYFLLYFFYCVLYQLTYPWWIILQKLMSERSFAAKMKYNIQIFEMRYIWEVIYTRSKYIWILLRYILSIYIYIYIYI